MDWDPRGVPRGSVGALPGAAGQPRAAGWPGRRERAGGRYGEGVHLKRVIPCLDVDGGRVVKGVEFVDIRDAGDPVELAAHYDREGADELVFLDITATHERRETIVRARAAHGGRGVRAVHDRRRDPLGADAQAVLDAGADKVAVNSAALQRPELIDELARVFGTQCVVLAIDAKARPATAVDGERGARARAASAPDGERGVAADAGVMASAPDGGREAAAEAVAPADAAAQWEAYLAGGRTPTGRDVVAWAREAVDARGGGDPADEHGPRRHERRLRPRADGGGRRTRSAYR